MEKSQQPQKKRLLLRSSAEMRIRDAADPILFPPVSPETQNLDVQSLLEPYSKDQIIEFLCEASLADPSLYSRILLAADRDVSHRKIFIHGLPWDSTKESLSQVFLPFGSIEECNVVIDKSTGRCKGYGFVLFESRSGALEALKQPSKMIGGRIARCQLASVGPTVIAPTETVGRKIYVSNVHSDVSADKLRVFFSKFGEIEAGPMGFDVATGKSRGYAVFLYKLKDGANKALEEPYKMFEGHRLHCQWATDTPKTSSVGIIGAASQQMQNFSPYSQIIPPYAAILGQNPFLAASIGVNPALIGGIPGYGLNSPVLSGSNNQIAAGLKELAYSQSLIQQPGVSYPGTQSYIW